MTRITIDGYAAAGKGTLAKDIAKKLGYIYLDTGKLYRYAALKIINYSKDIEQTIQNIKIQKNLLSEIGINQNIIKDCENFDQYKLNDEYIAQIASEISQIKNLRELLTQKQIEFMQKNQNVIADGRDIGTVICPQADVKFFVNAEINLRAKRRFEQNKQKYQHINHENKLKYIEEIKNQLIKRDEQDLKRKIAPLKKPENAIEIDTSNINRKQMLDIAIRCINNKKLQNIACSNNKIDL